MGITSLICTICEAAAQKGMKRTSAILRRYYLNDQSMAEVNVTTMLPTYALTGLLQTPLFYTSFRCAKILSWVHPSVVACSTAQEMVLPSVSRDTARQASPMVVSTV